MTRSQELIFISLNKVLGGCTDHACLSFLDILVLTHYRYLRRILTKDINKFLHVIIKQCDTSKEFISISFASIRVTRLTYLFEVICLN